MCKGTNCRVNGVRDIFISDDVCEGMKGSSGDESVQGVGISGEHPATCPYCRAGARVDARVRNQRQGIRPLYHTQVLTAGTEKYTLLTRNQQQGIRAQDPTPTVYLQALLYTGKCRQNQGKTSTDYCRLLQ